MGLGKNYPQPLNLLFSVEKVKVFQIRGMKKFPPLAPTFHRYPTNHYTYVNHFENACGVNQVCDFTQCLPMPVGGRKKLKTARVE